MSSILVTGANRGLGLEFCRQYAAAGWRVFATCREPGDAAALAELASRFPLLSLHALDVANFSQIDALSAELAGESCDLLLNNAGIYPDNSGLGNLDYQVWAQAFWVNTLAAVKMAEAFLPQVERSEGKLIAAVSSLMGSMTDNTSGGSYLYRTSKAALNAAYKSLSIDLRPRGVGVLILHPGWVQTDMGGKNALIDASESVAGMRTQLDAFTLKQTGGFIRYDGRIAPW
ncbi:MULTISPECIES: SDR family oxidoreductase [Methylomonas]|uniref:SDR family oxidoreductase n=1 Tax=Methylomonas TaxID=416 RepID=UPI0012325F6F|nr:SDR family oxidoreductase [Methylomonas rhizoryzae]